jgi:hypothetical protein
MKTVEAVAFLGGLMLFFVVFLSALSAYSKASACNPKTIEVRRLREGSWLICLDFMLILAILAWRSWVG